VLVVSGTTDANCPSWNGGEINLPGCCLSTGVCGISIGGTSCFAASEVGLSTKPCAVAAPNFLPADD
jgi:hypothetical protein